MMEIVLKVEVDEFLARKIENIVKKGAFKSEGEFLRSAVEDMVGRWEIRELNTKMDEFTEQVAEKHPESVSEAVLKAREEEDGILYSKYTQRKKFDDGIKQSKTKLKL